MHRKVQKGESGPMVRCLLYVLGVNKIGNNPFSYSGQMFVQFLFFEDNLNNNDNSSYDFPKSFTHIISVDCHI